MVIDTCATPSGTTTVTEFPVIPPLDIQHPPVTIVFRVRATAAAADAEQIEATKFGTASGVEFPVGVA